MSAIGHTMASRGSNPNNPKEVSTRAVIDRSQPQQQQQQQRGVQRQSASRNSSYASRKGSENLNHLLAFHLPPRIRAPPPSARRSKRGGHSAPFNKERYVNAQYRFLVKPTGDYTAHFADSDIRLQWGDILQILIPTLSAITEASASARAASSSTSQEFPEWLLDQSVPRVQEGATCPICLSSPSAPRMTKCGHVFCYACILHYLIVADGNSGGPATLAPSSSSHGSVSAPSTTPSRNWKRCPICWDSIYARDLKAVRWWDPKAKDKDPGDDHAADLHVHDRDAASQVDVLSLRLIERPHLTTLALPQSSTWPPPASSFHATSNHSGDDPIIPPHSAPWHFQPDVLPYARFMLATPSLVVAHLRADLAALRSERESAVALGSMVSADPASHADELGLQFIDLAILKVQEQIVKAQQELDVPSVNGTISRAKKALEEHEQQLHNIEKGRHSSRQSSNRRIQQQQQRRHRIGKSFDAAVEEVKEGSVVPEAHGVVDDHSNVSDFLAVNAGSQGGVTTPLPQSSTKDVSSNSSDVTSLSSDPVPTGPVQPRSRRNVNPPAPSSSSYLFYQAASGHPIYLHPLDIKILQSEYKSYTSFPHRIDVRVQSAEEGSMDEDLRKRCKYLAHLPMGADVVFIEVDWLGMVERADAKEAERVVLEEGGDLKPRGSAPPSPFAARDPVVSRAALAPYEHALKQRRNRRRDRERRDDRARQKAEDEGSVASGGVPIRSARELLTADDAELGWPGSSSFGSSVRSEDSSVGGAGTAGDAAHSPTFSQAALWGAERTFPMLPGAALDDDFPAALRGSPNGAEETMQPSGSSSYGSPPLRPATGTVQTVWGTHAPRAISSGSAVRQEEQDNGLDDAWMELEEDYILGRRGGAVKEGRGLNRQSGESSPSTPRTVPGAATPEEGGKPGGKKAKKKKLVLTGGGGGRGR